MRETLIRPWDESKARRTLGAVVWPALVVAIGYYVGARLGFHLTLAPVPVSILWPPNAILLSGLLLTRRSAWPLVLGCVLLAHLAVQFQSGVPAGMVLCWYISNCAEAVLGVLLLERLGAAPPAFETLKGTAAFLVCAIAAPFLSSFLDAGFVQLNDFGEASYWIVWRTRFFSNVLATITLVPVIVLTANVLARPKHLSRRSAAEAGLGLVALIALCTAVFASRASWPGAAPALLYSPLPLLVAAAVRFGPWGVSVAMLVCTLIATLGATQGLGPFVTSSSRDNAVAVQLFLVMAWGPVMALASVMRERAAAEANTRAREEQLAIALDAAQLASWEFDIPTATLTWSQATRRLYEVPPDAPVSAATFQAILHPDDRALLASVNADAAAGLAFDVEFRVVLPSGRMKWVHSKGKAICDEAGVPQRIVGVKADVTARKASELRIHEERQKIALSSRTAMAGELTVALAHELNQPLAAILVNAGAARRFLLQDPPDLQELSAIVDAIAHDNRRAADVITRFGTLLRAGEATRSPADMNHVVTSVLDVARGDLLARGVSVHVTLGAALPAVLCDATQVQQVLLNLIANSCDAMDAAPPGARRLRIATWIDSNGEVTVTVRDSGPGIPDEQIEEIFEPFVTSRPERLGLGLAICRSIVSAHGGRMWVERNPEGGAALCVALPAIGADTADAPRFEPAPAHV